MPLFKNDIASKIAESNNVLPNGVDSAPPMVEAYAHALERQLAASNAWQTLMHEHIEAGSSWSAVLHCAEASGLPADQLRQCVGAPPSTLSRWFNGLAQHASMLRSRLESELTSAVSEWIAQVTTRCEQARSLSYHLNSSQRLCG
ncbi:antitoxin Xre-like helix-turn-helix domain-containing protein [Rhodoblastus sp.]|jgi:hypothetical protein|uniref:antitoxin Xre-like helix-turn-helix domain-containing protein n=1 Tax=Rhodoblastus sp. TaxID=1962975 RepID=UPI0025EB4285|nr:antitoxin Xre-like helix-turn-helix domain-containing protein [Rhodoblastus sp.]